MYSLKIALLAQSAVGEELLHFVPVDPELLLVLLLRLLVVVPLLLLLVLLLLRVQWYSMFMSKRARQRRPIGVERHKESQR